MVPKKITTKRKRSRKLVDPSLYIPKNWVHCNFLCPLYCLPGCGRRKRSGLINYTGTFASAEGPSYSYEGRWGRFDPSWTSRAAAPYDVKRMLDTDDLAVKRFKRNARRRTKGIMFPFRCSVNTPADHHRSHWFMRRYLSPSSPKGWARSNTAAYRNTLSRSSKYCLKAILPFEDEVSLPVDNEGTGELEGKSRGDGTIWVDPLDVGGNPAGITLDQWSAGCRLRAPAEPTRRRRRKRRQKRKRFKFFHHLWERHPAPGDMHLSSSDRVWWILWKSWDERGDGKHCRTMRRWGLRKRMSRLGRIWLQRSLDWHNLAVRQHSMHLYELLKWGRQSFLNKALYRELLRKRRASYVAMRKYRDGVPKYVDSYKKFFVFAFSSNNIAELKAQMYTLRLNYRTKESRAWWTKGKELHIYPGVLRGFMKHLLALILFVVNTLVRQLDDLYQAHWLYLTAKLYVRSALDLLYLPGLRPVTARKNRWFRRTGRLLISLQQLLTDLPTTRSGIVDTINYKPNSKAAPSKYERDILPFGFFRNCKGKLQKYKYPSLKMFAFTPIVARDRYKINYTYEHTASKNTPLILEERWEEASEFKLQGFIDEDHEEARVIARRVSLRRMNGRRPVCKNKDEGNYKGCTWTSAVSDPFAHAVPTS